MTRFAYDDQIAAIPHAVGEALAREVPALDPERPILFSGIGTSLHAARVAATWIARLSAGQVRPHAVDAHDLGTGAVPIAPGDQVVVISHRGTKLFPNAALARAREAGAAPTIAIVGQSAPEQAAHHTIRTCPNETAGTFSVSYLASLAALARLAAPFEAAGDAFARALPELPEALERTLAMPMPEALVGALAKAHPVLVVGFGDDLVTAQEAALKLKEGAWIWTEAMSPEFALHGTPAAFHPEMGAVILEPDMDDRGRSALLREVLTRLGLRPVLTCGSARDGLEAPTLPFAPAPHPLLRPMLAILPFHRLTAELARLRGTDPDTLHGHREPWKTIMTGVRL